MFRGYRKYITLTCWTLSAICLYMAIQNGYTGDQFIEDVVFILNIIGNI